VLPLDARPADWAAACDAALSRAEPPPAYTRGWSQVAQEYLALYATLSR
jgi:hypothetical protein